MKHQYLLNAKYGYLKNELLNIREIFRSSDKSIHKARNELKIIELQGIKCVVKSFKVPHIINRIAYTFVRKGKAKKSYLNSIKLAELKISAPEAIGVIEFFSGTLLSESYFLSVYEPYDFTIREVFHHKVENYQEILKQFSTFTCNLHQKGVWHVDYSPGNILITEQEDGNYKFSLVDINRMEFKSIPAHEGLRNFSKFWARDDNDIAILATQYAMLSGYDTNQAIKIITEEAKALQKTVNLKKKLKNKR